jgi:hypothetical protein
VTRQQGPAPVGSPAPVRRDPADRAYRRAWWSLALYPVSFVAAFVIGEGLLSALTNGQDDPAVWQVLVAATPALLVFVVPGVLAVSEGRRATRTGRHGGDVPAIIGATVALAFVAQNLVSYLAGLLLG